MIELIEEIFIARKHEKLLSNALNVFQLTDHHNYWVVKVVNNIDNILDEQIDIFLTAKEIADRPQFDKNANLLILFEVTHEGNINRDLILKVEEDPYHFKKIVLFYSKASLASLNAARGKQTVIEFVESMILKEDVFANHKANLDSGYESLLYRIAHKLPFVRINIKATKSLESLEAINQEVVRENALNALLEMHFFNLPNNELEAMTVDEIIAKLEPIIPHENQ